jgi:hypothetical protein
MSIKKLILYSFMLVISLSFIGCSAKPTETKIVSVDVENPTGELIKVSEFTIKNGYNNKNNEIMGTVTNNNKMQCSFYINIIFNNADGSPLTTQNVRIADIKPGETINFDDMVIDTDISKATHKIQVREFF